MKKIILSVAIIVTAFFSFSCSEDFNVEAEFKPQYSLNSILRNDTTFQFVTLFTSYSPGNDPYTNTDYPAIKGADVKMYVNDRVYQFRDTTSPRSDTERYDEPLYYYYNDNFRPNTGEVIRVEAELPDGKVLSSETRVPRTRYFSLSGKGSRSFPDGTYIGGVLDIADKYQIVWPKLEGGEYYYLARLYFTYLHREDDNTYTADTVEIPIEFRTTTNEDVITYPKPTRNTWIVYDTFLTNETFRSISAGDPNKQDYIITGMYYDILVMDEEISAYYASSQLRLDAFSIKLRETNYSNIEGGLGIFGSITVSHGEFGLDDEYVQELFGYRVQID